MELPRPFLRPLRLVLAMIVWTALVALACKAVSGARVRGPFRSDSQRATVPATR